MFLCQPLCEGGCLLAGCFAGVKEVCHRLCRSFEFGIEIGVVGFFVVLSS